MENQISELLENHKIRKTEVRKDVLGIFIQAGEQALSSSDVEEKLGEMDRITLYRTLKTFEEKGLIHEAIDGSGTTKYAICKDGCTERHHYDHHAHFHCLGCGKTLCLEEAAYTKYHLPEDLQVNEVQVILRGTCSNCASQSAS